MKNIFNKKSGNQIEYLIILFLIALLILWQLINIGYLFTLDSVYGKSSGGVLINRILNINPYGSELSNLPFGELTYFLLLNFLSLIFPEWFIHKLLLFGSLFIGGLSFFYFGTINNRMSKYFSSTLYIINPYIYIRFMAGQLYLLLSYALLPFLAKLYMDTFENPSLKNIFLSGIFLSIISIQLQFLVIGVGLLLAILAFNLRQADNKFKNIKIAILILFSFSILNIGFLFSLLSGSGTLSTTISGISYDHLSLFTSKGSFDFNVLFNVAAMYGFWRGGYELPKDTLPYWYLFYFFILFLTVHGFLIGKNRPREGKYIKAIGLLAVISVILATGVSHPIIKNLFIFLYDHVPFFAGFREPQKFIAIVVFAYAYLGAIGLDDFASKIKKWDLANAKKSWPYMLLVVLALATPFIYTHSMLFGFNGQLGTTDYPADWYDMDDILNSDPQDFNVLFLPWHGYMDFKWIPNNDKRIANPANQFFSKPVIQGDTIEAGGIYSQSVNPFSRYIEYLLQNRNEIDNLGYLMVPLNVKYVILTKEADYQGYLFLKEQDDLDLVVETENLYLFKNINEVSRVYGLDEIPDFLVSPSFDLDSYETAEFAPLSYRKKSPAKYSLTENPDRRYIAFAVPQSKNWLYGKAQPVNDQGLINIYENNGSLPIENKNSKIYLILYGFSFAFFIALITLYLREK